MDGRYILLDPRYTNFRGQPGHFFEMAFKLPQLRQEFPGPIDGYLVPRQPSEFPGIYDFRK